MITPRLSRLYQSRFGFRLDTYGEEPEGYLVRVCFYKRDQPSQTLSHGMGIKIHQPNHPATKVERPSETWSMASNPSGSKYPPPPESLA
jgi:hypothetical protein